jgi:hypothetical protein
MQLESLVPFGKERLTFVIGILWKGKPLLFEEINIPKKGQTDPCAA